MTLWYKSRVKILVSKSSSGPGLGQNKDAGGKKDKLKGDNGEATGANVKGHARLMKVHRSRVTEVCMSSWKQGSGRALWCRTSPRSTRKCLSACGSEHDPSWFARRRFTCSKWSVSEAGGQPVSLCALSHATGWVYTHGQLCLDVRLHSPCVFGSWLSSSCVWWDNEVQVLLRRL